MVKFAVISLVSGEVCITISSLSKHTIAHVALIWAFLSMFLQMVFHITYLAESFVTVHTDKNLIVATALRVEILNLLVAFFILCEHFFVFRNDFV